MAKKQTDSQVLANWYSAAGPNQLMVAVYVAEAVLFAQVEEGTARKISNPVSMMRVAVQIEDAALSEDGSTYCWTFRRSKFHPSKGRDWLDVILGAIYNIIAENSSHLLNSDGTLMHRDNRTLDANTLSSFVKIV